MSKQIHLTSDILNSHILKATVGFDRFFNEMTKGQATINTSGYPPYNLARITDGTDTEQYEMTIAVAGFTEADIDIIVEDGYLKVSGTSGVLAEEAGTQVEYIHKGIAERNFMRSIKLHEHVEVSKATLRDGILKIKLVVNVPEEAKPKTIKISKS